MPEDEIKVTDIIVEYTHGEGKTKVLIVLNEQLSNLLGQILEIENYREHVKNIVFEKPKLERSTN